MDKVVGEVTVDSATCDGGLAVAMLYVDGEVALARAAFTGAEEKTLAFGDVPIRM